MISLQYLLRASGPKAWTNIAHLTWNWSYLKRLSKANSVHLCPYNMELFCSYFETQTLCCSSIKTRILQELAKTLVLRNACCHAIWGIYKTRKKLVYICKDHTVSHCDFKWIIRLKELEQKFRIVNPMSSVLERNRPFFAGPEFEVGSGSDSNSDTPPPSHTLPPSPTTNPHSPTLPPATPHPPAPTTPSPPATPHPAAPQHPPPHPSPHLKIIIINNIIDEPSQQRGRKY